MLGLQHCDSSLTICEHVQSFSLLSFGHRLSEIRSSILVNSELHDLFSKFGLVEEMKEQPTKRRGSEIVRERAQAVPFMGAMDGEEKSTELNMDHVYMRYIDFLWGYIFIGPMSYLLWLKGTFILRIRIFCIKRGWMKMKENDDIEEVIAKLCLEQTQVINYFAKTKSGCGSNNENTAVFFFTDFPYVDNDLNNRVADLFVVDINLDTKKFVKAKLDDLDLTASDTLILLWFNTIAAQHVKLHSMANWGINDHHLLQETNPFLRRNSIVTAIYNYFGYTSFSTFMETWEAQGLLSKGWSDSGCFIQCVNHGIKDGIGQHSNIYDIVAYSRFVKFVVKVRPIFMAEFAKHKESFPGIDGEVSAVGIIEHANI